MVSAVADSKVTAMVDLVGWEGAKGDAEGDAEGDALGETEGSGVAEDVGVELGEAFGSVGEVGAGEGFGDAVVTFGNFATVLQPANFAEESFRQRFEPLPPSMRSLPLPPNSQSLPSPPYR